MLDRVFSRDHAPGHAVAVRHAADRGVTRDIVAAHLLAALIQTDDRRTIFADDIGVFVHRHAAIGHHDIRHRLDGVEHSTVFEGDHVLRTSERILRFARASLIVSFDRRGQTCRVNASLLSQLFDRIGSPDVFCQRQAALPRQPSDPQRRRGSWTDPLASHH